MTTNTIRTENPSINCSSNSLQASLLTKTQDPGPHAKKYGAYQNQVYGAGMLHNIRPTVTKDPNKLEEQAKKEMTAKAYSYVGGGAGERATMDANRLAFRQWKVYSRLYY